MPIRHKSRAGSGKKGPIPKTVSEDNIETIERLAGYGLNLIHLAAFLNMSKATLNRRMQENTPLREAIEKGRARAVAKVAQMAFIRASSGRNDLMTMFWLKTRGGFIEDQEVEDLSKGKSEATGPAKFTREQLREMAQALLDQADQIESGEKESEKLDDVG